MAQKWEYKRVVARVEDGKKVVHMGDETREIKDTVDVLNELGEEGWELAGTTGGLNQEAFTFKRPKS